MTSKALLPRISTSAPLCTQVAIDVIGLADIGRDLGFSRSQDDELVKIFEDFLEPTAETRLTFDAI